MESRPRGAVGMVASYDPLTDYDRVIIQHDGEPAMRALAGSIQKHIGSSKVSVRESPPKQHQSQGAVESMNGFVASQIRALWLDVRKRYPSLDVSSNITPWLVRHAAWLIARFHTRSRDGMTPCEMITGGDYHHPIAMLGEIVLGKVPRPKGRAPTSDYDLHVVGARTTTLGCNVRLTALRTTLDK